MTRTEQLRRQIEAASGAAVHLADDPETPTASALDSPVHVQSVTLAVRDLAAVSAFYEDVVGLHSLNGGAKERVLGAGGQPLLCLIHEPDALPDDTSQAGLYHTAFLLPSRADLGRWLSRHAEAKRPLDGAADHHVSEALYLHDPEGNGIEIYADRSRAEWQWAERLVTMGNDPIDFAALLAAAGGRHWQAAPDATCVGHVHLRVGDAGEATRVYRDALGIDVTRQGPAASFMSWGGYHHHLAANVWHSAGAHRRDPRMAGLRSVTLAGRETAVTDPWGMVFGGIDA